jgi:hypothetical protein
VEVLVPECYFGHNLSLLSYFLESETLKYVDLHLGTRTFRSYTNKHCVRLKRNGLTTDPGTSAVR